MINNSEADYIHMDIMDGVFVPNISFGFPILKAVGKACKKPMDVHYMIVHPENYIQQTARCWSCNYECTLRNVPSLTQNYPANKANWNESRCSY